MFTGIIKELGTVIACRATSKSAELSIAAGLVPELKEGDSIAVNGVCLTAARLRKDRFEADAMPDTWRDTNLSFLQPGARVNLEPALTLSDRLGGHLVSGHVDGIGRVTGIKVDQNAVRLKVTAPGDLMRFIPVKGSVAVNGVSLTVQATAGEEFTVSLIPHTMKETNLHSLKQGDPVNLEVDMLARYLKHLLTYREENSDLTLDFLAKHGFN